MITATWRRALSALVVGVLSAGSVAACSSGPKTENGLTTVRYTQSTPTLSFAPVLVAREMGFFEKHGIDLKFSEQESGTIALQALLGDSADVANIASTDLAGAVARGSDLTAVQATTKMTMQVCVSSSWLEKKGVAQDASFKDKLAALRGATIGVTKPGAISDRAMRWLLSKHGGLDPNKDVKLISVNGASGLNSALRTDRIQAYLLSPPSCDTAQKQGYGQVYVRPTEVPTFADTLLQVAVVKKSYLDDNEDVVRRMVQALDEGNRFIVEHPDKAISLLQKHFETVDAGAIETSMKKVVIPQTPRDGRMEQDLWAATKQIIAAAGIPTTRLDTREGEFWTNEYATAPD